MCALKVLGSKQLGHVLHSNLLHCTFVTPLLFGIDKVADNYVAATEEKRNKLFRADKKSVKV